MSLDDILAGNLSGVDAAKVLDNTSAEDLQDFVKTKGLKGGDIAKLTPGGYGAEKLTFGQNMQSLKSQGKSLVEGGVTKAPKRMFDAGMRGLKESGGGFRAGTGHFGRYMLMGGKATTLTTALPGVRDAFKKEDPTGQGRSQTERIGASVGEVAGNVLTSLPNSVTNRLGILNLPVSLAGGLAGGYVGKKVGGAVGSVVDKGVSAVRGVQAGDVTHQPGQTPTKRKPGSGAI